MNKPARILIQLMGEQTIPNILPISIIKPNRVYNLCTEKTTKQGERVNKGVKNKYRGGIESSTQKLRDADLGGTRQACKELLAKHKGEHITLNLTGGTKLMSLAMYQIAEKTAEDVSVIYVQHGQQEIITRLKRASWDIANTEGEQAAGDLEIMDFLEVGEQAPESVKGWHPLVPAAKAIQQMADSINAGKALQGSANDPDRKMLSKLRRAALKAPQLQKSFAKANCLFSAINSHEAINNTSFLDGMWWEVLVADYLERSGKYREVMCSVKTSISEECGTTDVDVLATDGRTLTCFSCKRSLKNPGSEINKHASRSRKLGGAYIKSGIAVYKGNNASYTALKNLAKAEKMEVLTGPDVCPTKRGTNRAASYVKQASEEGNGAPAADSIMDGLLVSCRVSSLQ